MRSLRRIGCLVLLGFSGASPALAECYDVFGCANANRFQFSDLISGPTCEFLYVMRNEIYAEHGYCFHTPRAIAAFGNASCVSGDVDALPLNGYERANAVTILRAERAKQCPE